VPNTSKYTVMINKPNTKSPFAWYFLHVIAHHIWMLELFKRRYERLCGQIMSKKKPFKISTIRNSEIIHKLIICLLITLLLGQLAQTTTGISQIKKNQRERLLLTSSSGKYRKRKVSKRTISKNNLNPRWMPLLLMEECCSQWNSNMRKLCLKNSRNPNS
jgi:hypothetical protein